MLQKFYSYFLKTKILERVTKSLLQVLLKAISNHLKDIILMNDVMMTFWKRPAGNVENFSLLKGLQASRNKGEERIEFWSI